MKYIIDGKSYYPVGHWENVEHKLETQYTRMKNALDDMCWNGSASDDIGRMEDRIDRLRAAIDNMRFIQNGRYTLAIAEYNDYKICREMIQTYDILH